MNFNFNRRDFLKVGGASVFGYALTHLMEPPKILGQNGETVRGTAKNLIFINLNGGPTHCDTFDLKSNEDVTDNSHPLIRPPRAEELMGIDTFSGINLPGYIFRNLKDHADKMVIVRSHWGWSNAHNIAQYWNYTGQDFNPAFAAERPNIGAVVALEAWRQRQPGDVLPGFVLLNSNLPYKNGFLSGLYAPFEVTTAYTGLGTVLDHPAEGGQARFQTRWDLLQGLEPELRGPNPPLGKQAADFSSFYEATKAMMYNTTVQEIFRYAIGQGSEAQRYAPIQVQSDGVTPVTTPGAGANPNGEPFGNACLVARNLIKAGKGTRAIWITLGGWDQHGQIYGGANPNPNGPGSIYFLGRRLDAGVGNLVADLRKTPGSQAGRTLLDETLIVILGDFGRTPASRYDARYNGTNSGLGRDHWNQTMTCAFIGGGINGGRVIGESDQHGDRITEIGWDPPERRPGTGPYPGAGPYIRTEDLFYSIYSALGINPRTRILDTPSRRVFIYVPRDFFGEVPLW
jgi:hypothetical protein